ncbi:phosphopantothenoylcysteine decarboxylase, partial [Wenyingzhuangia sp. 1_MG-2023]|nr:phosphopantothenoylcysteine decarboxylase [Wenyingzhuangia sp. 1_MG-2023]
VDSYARDKLERKNLDMIIANDVSRQDIGFGAENNAVTLYSRHGTTEFDVMNKTLLARQLIAAIAQQLKAQ